MTHCIKSWRDGFTVIPNCLFYVRCPGRLCLPHFALHVALQRSSLKAANSAAYLSDPRRLMQHVITSVPGRVQECTGVDGGNGGHKKCVKTVVVTVNDSLSVCLCVSKQPFSLHFILKTVTYFSPICSYPFMLAACVLVLSCEMVPYRHGAAYQKQFLQSRVIVR